MTMSLEPRTSPGVSKWTTCVANAGKPEMDDARATSEAHRLIDIGGQYRTNDMARTPRRFPVTGAPGRPARDGAPASPEPLDFRAGGSMPAPAETPRRPCPSGPGRGTPCPTPRAGRVPRAKAGRAP